MTHPLEPTQERSLWALGLTRRARRIALNPASHAEDGAMGQAFAAIPDAELRGVLVAMTLTCAALMLQLDRETGSQAAVDAYMDAYEERVVHYRPHGHNPNQDRRS